MSMALKDKNIAVFGGGCFWCTEAVFQDLKGVESVVSGYAGGTMTNPNYEAVSSGRTGHAEVIQITYDPSVISFETLLEVFFATHDPTTLNRQGNDLGTQYRSVIFSTSPEQQATAEAYVKKANSSGEYKNQVVTEVIPLDQFYSAEDYHQNYFKSNPAQPYCSFVIGPKIQKLREKFGHLLKSVY